MSWSETIKRASKEAWYDSLLWFLLNLFCLGIPIGSTYLFTLNNYGSASLKIPISHGEIPLFSLTLLVSSVLILIKGVRISGLEQIKKDKGSLPFDKLFQYLSNISFPGLKVFSVLLIIEIVIAVLVFSLSFTRNPSLDNYSNIIDIHISISLGILVISFITTFFITITDAALDNSRPHAYDLFNVSNADYQQKLTDQEWES